MAYAFAKEPCPTFYYKSGKPYKGIVHHLIEKPEDYRPANLLWWLSQPEHSEADRRRRALEAIVPNGNMYAISYARHRQLQDPRRMSREQFEIELDKLKKQFEEEAKMQAMNERALRAMKALQPTPEQRQRGLDAQAGERTKYYDPFIERETVEIEICIDD
jgi:hypothetical protein